ncbi:EAL domain-containing protein [Lacticaseibacillus thailandensis]|uniref:EAL domain-containing protein n=1 Tax=Lacticaseibacillus thailandensis TaxID=381741 RepID=UPI0006D07125|nr:EAL domain-containing protein [Lacticaseibacillus thailandensis]
MSTLFFVQPIVDIDTGSTLRYELLLRERCAAGWRLPSSFGLSFSDVRRLMWQALASLELKRLTLNVTVAQFVDARFIDQLVTLRENTPLLDCLHVELAALPDIAAMQRTARVLNSVGIRVTVDDVGAANLTEDVEDFFPYLHDIKYAMQNVRVPGNHADVEAQVGYWKRLADEYGLGFTLTGIESHADVDVANQLGITTGQGFYYGRPVLPGRMF